MKALVEVVTRAMDYEWEIVCMPDALAHPARGYFEATSHHQASGKLEIVPRRKICWRRYSKRGSLDT